MTPIISIIVPVYNAEKYLRRCLDSILMQTYTDWECLLVDDGSLDTSGNICEEYVSLDSRFISIHKSNAGVSRARNMGLDKSRGKYVCFIDSDDYWESNSLMSFIRYITCNEYVLGVAPHTNITDNGVSVYGKESGAGRVTGKDEIITELENRKCLDFIVCWSKWYSKDLIDKYGLRFPETISHSEDFCFVIDYISCLLQENGVLYCISENTYRHLCLTSGNLSSMILSVSEYERMSILTTDSMNRLRSLVESDKLDWMYKKIIKNCINSIRYTPFRDLNKIYRNNLKDRWKSVCIVGGKINLLKTLLTERGFLGFILSATMLKFIYKIKDIHTCRQR